ncbi:Putative eukaryotic rRNA processing [Septoria linicola]|uniref:Eukaryotic rRNA processing n=1 Tax=Septoria linicola TaxID=215465 RepID=A0A9Q9AW11_9PEZI|nr:Putative eukaryotic rRNA processing [Septoria linicola]
MAKAMKLKAALDRQKGVNHKLEKQKKQQKEAEKRKRPKQPKNDEESEGEDGEQDVDFAALESVLAGAEVIDVDDEPRVDKRQKPKAGNRKERRAAMLAAKAEAEAKEIAEGATNAQTKEDAEGWETDESEDAEDADGGVEIGAMSDESESESEIENDVAEDEDDDDEDDEDQEDIPLSDLDSVASEDKEDVVPHQRLTINNTTALARSLKSIALPASLPFSAVQAVTSEEPVDIADVEDDLNRELAFYRQSLNAVTEARSKLKAEGVAFTRPTDYFAEMVKSEEQMGKVRAKLLDETARKKASSDARRQRDLKKFGKQVQVAKLQERQKEKTATLDRIQTLKRKRQGADLAANETDPFDVALEDAATTAAKDKADRKARGEGPNRKRQKKDEKFGFGGKKRFAKSNDAKSAADDSGYSVKRMKGGGKGKPRPGKSKRSRA